MIVETTLRKALFLRMGTWLIPADRETNRRRRELREWISKSIAEQLEDTGAELLPGGGFTLARASEEDAYRPVEIDFTVEQLALLPAMFARGVVWPNSLTEEQDDEVDELEADVTEWGKQEAAARALKTLTKKQRKRLEDEEGDE